MMYVLLEDEAPEFGVGVGAVLIDGVVDNARLVMTGFGWVGVGAWDAGPPKMDDTGA